MSFFERAKAAASDLAAKADVEMKKAGISTPGAAGAGGAAGADRALRDLGVLAYLEATGRPASADDRARVLATLRELESSGRLGPLTVAPPAYGTPGARRPRLRRVPRRLLRRRRGRHPAAPASARCRTATAAAARHHRLRPRAGPSPNRRGAPAGRPPPR